MQVCVEESLESRRPPRRWGRGLPHVVDDPRKRMDVGRIAKKMPLFRGRESRPAFDESKYDSLTKLVVSRHGSVSGDAADPSCGLLTQIRIGERRIQVPMAVWSPRPAAA